MAEVQNPRQITAEEVALHNKKTDCWIVIHGKVYDVTKFAPEHPGGSSSITDHAGKSTADVSVDFDNVGHSADAKS
jgi:cytochrome-b5 reductase